MLYPINLKNSIGRILTFSMAMINPKKSLFHWFLRQCFLMKWFVTFVSIFVLFSCNSARQLEPLPDGSVVVAFGDSLTVGVGAKSVENYPNRLNNIVPFEVIGSGVSGEQTNAGLKRLPSVLTQYQPDLVLLCLGGNDFIRRIDEHLIKQNLISMIELIKNSGSEVLLIAVPEPSLILSPSPIYQEIAQELNIPLLEDPLTDLLSDSRLKSDTIHLNAKGYKKLADAIKNNLIETGLLLN